MTQMERPEQRHEAGDWRRREEGHLSGACGAVGTAGAEQEVGQGRLDPQAADSGLDPPLPRTRFDKP